MSLPAHKRRALIQETRAIFRKADAAYAPYSCPASGECCQLATTKREPWVHASEWEALVEHLRGKGRELPPDRADGGCPFLDAAGKRCTVYEARPFGCRTFFCHRIRGPKKQPVQETDELLRRLAAINEDAAADEAPGTTDPAEDARSRRRRPSPGASMEPGLSGVEGLRATRPLTVNGGPLTEWIRVHRASLPRHG